DHPDIHQLAYQVSYTMDIPLHDFVQMSVLMLVVSPHQSFQRANNEGKRCTDLMGNIDKELEFRFIDFFPPFVRNHLLPDSPPMLNHSKQDQPHQQYNNQINGFGNAGQIPYRVDNNGY